MNWGHPASHVVSNSCHPHCPLLFKKHLLRISFFIIILHIFTQTHTRACAPTHTEQKQLSKKLALTTVTTVHHYERLLHYFNFYTYLKHHIHHPSQSQSKLVISAIYNTVYRERKRWGSSYIKQIDIFV